MNSDEGAFLRNVSQGCLLSFLFLRTVVFGGFGQLADVRLWSNAGTVLILRDLNGPGCILGDLTTDKYSFVIKCPASRHLPMRKKTPPPCRGGGSKSRRGFPPTYHSARKTKGSLHPSTWRTKRPLWPLHGEQKGRYAPVGVRPPPPLRGSSPCKAGQFIPAGFDCRHSEVCKSRNSVLLNSFF